MKKFLIIGFSMLLVCCNTFEESPTNRKSLANEIGITIDDFYLIEQLNTFAVNFVKAIPSDEKNFVVSPLSISMGLTMLANGAEDQTLDEITELLCYGKEKLADANLLTRRMMSSMSAIDDNTSLFLSHSLWFNEKHPMQNAFKEKMRGFDAEIFDVDFANPHTANDINNWLSSKTKNIITKLSDEISLSADINAILLNAIYFNAEWNETFKTSRTTKATFTNSDGSETMVDMMHGDKIHAHVLSLHNGTAVCLPSKNYEYQIVIAMHSRSTNAFDYMQRLTPDDNELLSMYNINALVDISLPRINLSSDIDIYGALEYTEVNKTPVMSEDSRYKRDDLPENPITEWRQQAMLCFDETEGSSASAWPISKGDVAAMPLESYKIEFNRPFIFLIYERSTGIMLLAGKVEQL